jgi:hypothetical protein
MPNIAEHLQNPCAARVSTNFAHGFQRTKQVAKPLKCYNRLHFFNICLFDIALKPAPDKHLRPELLKPLTIDSAPG